MSSVNRLTSVVIALLINPPVSLRGADYTNASILASMRAADSTVWSSCEVTLEIEEPAHSFLPDQGNIKKMCALLRGEAFQALECTTIENAQILYRPLGTPGYETYDYDGDDLIVWHLTSQVMLIDTSRNEAYREYRGGVVNPRGQLVEETTAQTLSVYKPSDHTNASHLEHYSWTTGRGFSGQLDRIVEHRVDANQMVHCRAAGSHASTTWKIILDPGAGWLVRSATLTRGGQGGPSIICTTTGTESFDGVAVARSGRVVFLPGTPGSYEIVGRLVHYDKRSDENQLTGIRRALTTARTNPDLQLMDYRENPGRPIATRGLRSVQPQVEP